MFSVLHSRSFRMEMPETMMRMPPTVDTSAMAGLVEKADAKEAELLSAELVFVDDYVIPGGKQRIMSHKEDR